MFPLIFVVFHSPAQIVVPLFQPPTRVQTRRCPHTPYVSLSPLFQPLLMNNGPLPPPHVTAENSPIHERSSSSGVTHRMASEDDTSVRESRVVVEIQFVRCEFDWEVLEPAKLTSELEEKVREPPCLFFPPQNKNQLNNKKKTIFRSLYQSPANITSLLIHLWYIREQLHSNNSTFREIGVFTKHRKDQNRCGRHETFFM